MQPQRAQASHVGDFTAREEHSLRKCRRRACRLKRRVRAAHEKRVGTVRPQILAGRVEIAELRRMFDAARVDAATAKLLSVKWRSLGGDPERPPETRQPH